MPIADLFQSFVSARERGKSKVHALAVEYRGSIKKQAVFLVTKESAVVGQFRIDEELLQRRNMRFESWMDTDKVRKQIERQNTANSQKSIQELRHGMKKVNVDAEVIETTTLSHVQTQYGNTATVTNATIGDGTGSIRLCLWNEHARRVLKGDFIQIKNASVSSYKGERQLSIGKTGTVNVVNNTK